MKRWLLLFSICLVSLSVGLSTPLFAHGVPSTYAMLTVTNNAISGTLKIPLTELDSALKEDLNTNAMSAVQANKQRLTAYLIDHIHVSDPNGEHWSVRVANVHAEKTTDNQVGEYYALIADVTLTPPTSKPIDSFTLTYDAVVREYPSHVVLVSVKDNSSDGIVTRDDTKYVGIIQADSNGAISPLSISVTKSSLWEDFLGMVRLGMSHIKEGTDHLLFLLTLLIPAPLIAVAHRWKKFGGTKRSLLRILKITTAFTIGHSLTLIATTLLHPAFPSWPVELLIAISIIVSASHALRPLFPEKEMLIAGGFGLIHGMAFSFTLAELHLTTEQLVVSLLGFNIGIELMQLIIICITMPPLIYLATTKLYPAIRISASLLALVAAIGWAIQRVGFPNPISTAANLLSGYAVWLIVILAALAIGMLIKRFYYTAPLAEELTK